MNDIIPTHPAEVPAKDAAKPLGITAVEIREVAGLYDKTTGDNILWLHVHAGENGLDYGGLERALKVDRTTITRVMRGIYKNGAGKIIRPDSFNKAVATLRRGAATQAGRVDIGFVETETSGLIFDIIHAAARDRQAALIHGPSHVGKTHTLREAVRRTPGAYYMTVLADSGMRGFVRDMAEALGLRPDGMTHAEIKRAIRARLDENTVLVIDEAHQIVNTFSGHQRVATIEWLRQIVHDGAGATLILCGTHVWGEALSKSKLAPLLTQVVRRGRELYLKDAPSAEDVGLIVSAYGFPRPVGEARSTILRVAREDGIKAVCTRLSRAIADAAEEGRPVEWADVLNADHTINLYRTGEIYAALARSRAGKDAA